MDEFRGSEKGLLMLAAVTGTVVLLTGLFVPAIGASEPAGVGAEAVSFTESNPESCIARSWAPDASGWYQLIRNYDVFDSILYRSRRKVDNAGIPQGFELKKNLPAVISFDRKTLQHAPVIKRYTSRKLELPSGARRLELLIWCFCITEKVMPAGEFNGQKIGRLIFRDKDGKELAGQDLLANTNWPVNGMVNGKQIPYIQADAGVTLYIAAYPSVGRVPIYAGITGFDVPAGAAEFDIQPVLPVNYLRSEFDVYAARARGGESVASRP